MKRDLLALGVAMMLATSSAATAQPVPAPVTAEAPFTADTQRTVVEAIATALIENYVFPEVGSQAATHIRDRLAAGQYSGLGQAAFADQLTKDLQGVTHDLHMRVTREGAPPPPAEGTAPRVPQGVFLFEAADRLRGNIGYLRIDGFLPPELFQLGADPVMDKLKTTDALIIDMRDNHGGHPGGVSYLVSFFFDPATPVHINDLVWREPGKNTFRREVFSTTRTPVSYLGKPVFVLTGKGTFSGGEEFSYDMQQLRRAQLVGETTGGGANPGRIWPLGNGLTIFIPTGRAENPVSKTNWEGVGVKPEVGTKPDDAFATAYAMALEAVRKPSVRAATPDDAREERLLVRRTEPYALGAEFVRLSVEGLVRGEQPFQIFSPSLAEELKGPVPPELQAMMAQLGAVQAITFLGVDGLGGDEYEVRFANGRQIWSIVINKDDKLVSVNFSDG